MRKIMNLACATQIVPTGVGSLILRQVLGGGRRSAHMAMIWSSIPQARRDWGLRITHKGLSPITDRAIPWDSPIHF